MNARTIALFILFLSFGFIAKVEIPSGIVYSDDKNAIKPAKTEKTTWGIAKTPTSEEFKIGGIKFTWLPIDTEKMKAKEEAAGGGGFDPTGTNDFSLKIQYPDQAEDIGYLIVPANIKVRNPSWFRFDPRRLGGWGSNKGDSSTMLLKIGNKYMAIQPLEKKGDSITYKWKFWPKISLEPARTNTLKPAKKTPLGEIAKAPWGKIAKTPVSEEFEIGGIKFSWQPIDIEKREAQEKAIREGKPFLPENDFKLKIQYPDQTEDIGYAIAPAGTGLRDPSLIIFRMVRLGGCGSNKGGGTVLFLKIGNKYIAIQPLELENEGDLITYEWKFWPEIPLVKEIPNKTALKSQ